jgi:hypothetical protein
MQGSSYSHRQMLRYMPPRGALYAESLHRFQKLCKYTQKLPQSSKIPGIRDRSQYDLISKTFNSDVYRGCVEEAEVAVKYVRFNAGNLEQMRRVSSSALLSAILHLLTWIFKAFCNEVVLWSYLRHDNIVPVIGVSDVESLCVVSPWMHHGALDDYLANNPDEDRIHYVRVVVGSSVGLLNAIDIDA